MFGFSKRPQPTIKICTGQVMEKSTQKELEKHYRFMLNSSKQELKGYIQSGVISGKFWMIGIFAQTAESVYSRGHLLIVELRYRYTLAFERPYSFMSALISAP